MKRIVFLMAGLTAIVAVAVVLTLIIVNALRTPVNGPVRHYDALFTDASGLIVGNDVRISGVQVGKVEKIHLDGKNARITFNVLTDHPLYQKHHRGNPIPVAGRAALRRDRTGADTQRPSGGRHHHTARPDHSIFRYRQVVQWLSPHFRDS
ncbi:mce related family protein [Mycobacteroides abscessus 1948]|uniref:Mce related family protein n=1 Tax=Mycobacteroides abscessus 1948 TaxID=1299323 RepID=A0A829QKD9_9MYCO|nr:mce related family protein [Mycobacteroides abscessus 1948]